jgi:hypothetical protein
MKGRSWITGMLVLILTIGSFIVIYHFLNEEGFSRIQKERAFVITNIIIIVTCSIISSEKKLSYLTLKLVLFAIPVYFIVTLPIIPVLVSYVFFIAITVVLTLSGIIKIGKYFKANLVISGTTVFLLLLSFRINSFFIARSMVIILCILVVITTITMIILAIINAITNFVDPKFGEKLDEKWAPAQECEV